MDIQAYFNSKESYLKKEEVLFTIIDELAEASNDIFDEIYYLSDNSYYKITSLKERIDKLKSLYQIIVDNYEVINKIELSSYSYASKRWAFKWLIASTLIVNIILKYALLTIGSYFAINYIIGKDYIEEKEEIDKRIARFDEKKLNGIGITLNNCERLLLEKQKCIADNMQNNPEKALEAMLANDIISAYLLGIKEGIEPAKISEHTKKIIRDILREDLNTKKDDIGELLEQEKNRETKTLKLLKKYES